MLEGVPAWIREPFFKYANENPWIGTPLNRVLLDVAARRGKQRPRAFSTMAPYTSWAALTDKTWSGRHLGPDEDPRRKGSTDRDAELATMFARPAGDLRECPKSTLLFPSFAQYLTDGFIRTLDGAAAGQDPATGDYPYSPLKKTDPDAFAEAERERFRRNSSTHNIDLCTLYGRTEAQTDALRLKSEAPGEKGRLKSQVLNGEEWSPFLYDDDLKVKPEFAALDFPLGVHNLFEKLPAGGQTAAIVSEMIKALFAAGGDRVNTAPQTAMMNTILLREHNRLAGEIEKTNPTWDDGHVFAAARATVIVTFIRIVVEDYINHITPLSFNFRADPSVCWQPRGTEGKVWAEIGAALQNFVGSFFKAETAVYTVYKGYNNIARMFKDIREDKDITEGGRYSANWNQPAFISTEFSLLYRWHPLIPDTITWGGHACALGETLFNNALLLKRGLRGALEDMSSQATGEMGPFNTTADLLKVERASIKQDRLCQLQTYAKYRKYLGMEPPKSFSDISKRPEVVDWLERHYDSVDQVDFYVGLFAEDRVKNSPLPPTIMTMVALDAFTQALPNPLLAPNVFKEETFSKVGWAQVTAPELQTMAALAERNGLSGEGFIGMTRPGWTPED